MVPIAELSEQIVDPHAVVYRPMETLLVPPRGIAAMLLIGDAAHSRHTALGAGRAPRWRIEDAVLLAELLGRPGDLSHTWNALRRARLPRCRLVMDVGLKRASGRWRSGTGVAHPTRTTAPAARHARKAGAADLTRGACERRFIDLSIYLENDVVSDPPLYRPHIDYIDHKMSPGVDGLLPRAEAGDLPAGEAWAIERIQLITITVRTSMRRTTSPRP